MVFFCLPISQIINNLLKNNIKNKEKLNMKNIISNTVKLFTVVALFSVIFNALNANTLKIYSERQPFLIEPLIKAYEKNSGTKVEWIFAKKGLVQKIILEKDNPIGDVFLSSDISRLIDVSEAGASIKLSKLSGVPDHLQSSDWVALTQRARIIYVNKTNNINNINYEDLIKDEFKGKVCTRSGFHPYNISLFASLMEHYDKVWLKEYLTKLKQNLARKPQGNDRDQVKAIAAGVCDVSLGNHYYYFKMLDNDDQKGWLDKAKPIFPNQDSQGTHVNISGISLINPATKAESIKFLEFLVSEEAQAIYASDNNEFPVTPSVSSSSKVEKLVGNAEFDTVDLITLANNRKAVVDILNQINFDE